MALGLRINCRKGEAKLSLKWITISILDIYS